MTELELAIEVMQGADKTYWEAQKNSWHAAAEVARLTFLEYAAQHPTKIKGFSFEATYEYDDEGGYFTSVSTYPLISECTADDLDEYELMDLMNGFGQPPLALLCGVHTDAYSGECTVEQARERRF